MSPDAFYRLLDVEAKEIKQLRICNEEILEAVIVDAEEEHQKSDKVQFFIAAVVDKMGVRGKFLYILLTYVLF